MAWLSAVTRTLFLSVSARKSVTLKINVFFPLREKRTVFLFLWRIYFSVALSPLRASVTCECTFARMRNVTKFIREVTTALNYFMTVYESDEKQKQNLKYGDAENVVFLFFTRRRTLSENSKRNGSNCAFDCADFESFKITFKRIFFYFSTSCLYVSWLQTWEELENPFISRA